MGRGATDWEIDNEVQRQYEDLHGYNDVDEPIREVWVAEDKKGGDGFVILDLGGVYLEYDLATMEDAEAYCAKKGWTIVPKPEGFA